MAAKSGSGASTQALYEQAMTAMIRNYTNAPDNTGRQKALKDGIKSLRAFGINDALTGAFEKIAELGPDKLDKTMEMILTLAQGQATRKQDLQKESAQMWMQAMAQPGNTVAHICALATGLGTICRFFGAHDFADSLEEQSKMYLKNAKEYYQADTGRISENGSDEVSAGLTRALALLKDGKAARASAEAARDAAGVAGPEDFPHLNGGASGPAAAGRTKLTWAAFRENMVTAGVAEPTVTKLERLFRENAAFNKGGDNEVLAANEGARLLRQAEAQKIVTPADAAKMKGYIERTAEKGPV